MTTDSQQVGRVGRRGFVTSLVASGLLTAGGAATGGIIWARSRERQATADQDYPISVNSAPVNLRKGDLLVTDQKNGEILHVQNGKASQIANVASWSHSYLFDAVGSSRQQRIWFSMTGLNTPGDSYYFGVKGVGRVLEVDTTTGRLVRVYASPEFVDPAGLRLSPDERSLYVADFNSFGDDGRLHRLDLSSGDVEVITRGKYVTTPVGLNLAGPDTAVMGVAKMPEATGTAGGRIVLVDLRSGEQTLVHEHVDDAGELIGAVALPDGSYAATRSEWPDQARSAVFTTSGGSDFSVLHASNPGFFSSGIAWSGKGIWTGESTSRELRHIALDGTVMETVKVPGASPGPKLKRASETLEAVSIVV